MIAISATIVADSIAETNARLVTFSLVYPRYIHAQLMTHRAFSRNSASSRAIPVKKNIDQVKIDPVIPVEWGMNQPGMQAKIELAGQARGDAIRTWLDARDEAVKKAEAFVAMGLHKQIANRVLEPWLWMYTLVTSTEWGNWFNLRIDFDAQAEIRALAREMLKALNASIPKRRSFGQYHAPYVSDREIAELGIPVAVKCSVARCARVSYKNHDGTNPVVEKDIALHDDLFASRHVSPFEHQGLPLRTATALSGNFRGWAQYRKSLAGENRSFYPDLIQKTYEEGI